MMGQDHQGGTDTDDTMMDTRQMNQMMSRCNQMREGRMPAPNSQFPKPEHKG